MGRDKARCRLICILSKAEQEMKAMPELLKRQALDQRPSGIPPANNMRPLPGNGNRVDQEDGRAPFSFNVTLDKDDSKFRITSLSHFLMDSASYVNMTPYLDDLSDLRSIDKKRLLGTVHNYTQP